MSTTQPETVAQRETLERTDEDPVGKSAIERTEADPASRRTSSRS